MKKQFRKTIKDWMRRFNKENGLSWGLDEDKDTITVYEKNEFVYVELKTENILEVFEESAGLIFRLKNGQSISILGYKPGVSVYTTA